MLKIGISGHREDKITDKNLCIKTIYGTLNNVLSINNNIILNLGGANGIDNWVGLWCIENNIKYILHLPFKDKNKQIYSWSISQKEDFKKILKYADNICYYDGYLSRNRGIIDNSDILYYYCTNIKSGTGYTINYAKSKKIPIKSLIS